MTDILGPGSNIVGATTTRPADSRVLLSSDTWLRDCSSPAADDGTPITADLLNGIIASDRAVVRANGTVVAGGLVVQEDNSDGMKRDAILHLIQRSKPTKAFDSGVVNALVATMVPTPAELADGMQIVIKPAVTNTGPSTLSLLATKSIQTGAGAALTGGELVAGVWRGMRWNSALDVWRITDAAAPLGIIHKGPDTSATVNLLTASMTPSFTSYQLGDEYIVTGVLHTGTGPVQANFGPGLVNVVRADGTPAQARDIVIGQGLILIFDGTNMQITGVVTPLAISINPLFFHVETQRANGVSPPAMSNSGPYATWKMNTVLTNQIPGASLNATTGQITLPPGNYRAFYGGACHSGGQHKCRLFNQTSAVEIGHGLTCDSYVPGGGGFPTTNVSSGLTRFVIAATSVITLDHINTDGFTSTFGDNSSNDTNVDAYVRLEKELGI